MLILRRWLLLWLLMFWQGGFFFYSAVVVFVGSQVLDSDFEQGMITRRVTIFLNLAGLVVLAAWISDLLCERATHLKRRWGVWLFLVATLALLAWLHPQMDAMIETGFTSRSRFRYLHRWYLWISTFQWLASVVLTLWTLQNWRASDQRRTTDGVATG